MKRRVLIWTSALFVLASLDPAFGETRRLAVVVGNNAGSGARPPLRYAESDASKFASVLVELGGVEPGALFLLQGKTLPQLHEALSAARETVRLWHQDPGTRVILIFFFSGHSDGEVLEIGKEPLAFGAARRVLTETGADLRLGIIDSCKSGALLASKGATPGPAFQIRLMDELLSTGEAILTSSAADEVALESKEIGGSFFTHHLVSGMRGAADISGDGIVTLAEAYQYAFSHTVSATAATVAGTQHPAYDYQLAGQGDLVLTELWRPNSALELPSGFDRLMVSGVVRDQVLAELPAGANRKLAVVPGEYAVLGWTQDKLYGTRVAVASGETRRVKKEDLLFKEKVSTVAKGGELVSPVEKTAEKRKNLLTVDLTWAAVGIFTLHYERATDRRLSFFIRLPELLHQSETGALRIQNDTTTTFQALVGSSTHLGISGGLRFFIFGEAPRGLWLSPEVGFGYRTYKLDRLDTSGAFQGTIHGELVTFHFSASAGYTFVFGPVALWAGAGAAYFAEVGEFFGVSLSQRHVIPFVQTGIGYAF